MHEKNVSIELLKTYMHQVDEHRRVNDKHAADIDVVSISISSLPLSSVELALSSYNGGRLKTTSK